MKKITKKLLLSVLAVAFAFVALGTTTFAWFTVGNLATVNQFDLNVQNDAGTGLEIGTTTGNLGTDAITITPADDFKLLARTSSNGKTFKKADYFSYGVPNIDATDGYYEFQLTFRVDQQYDADIYLGASTTVTGTDITDDGTVYNAADAVRISFTVGSADAVIYEPNKTGSVSDFGGAPATDATTQRTNNAAMAAYHAVYAGTNADEAYRAAWTSYNGSAVDGIICKDVVPTTFTTKGITGGTPIATIDNANTIPNVITVTVRVWLEGWDSQCYNGIEQSNVSITLGFVADLRNYQQ